MKSKDILIAGFALFSMFFGAGNLILPPYLGFKAGEEWPWVTLGFLVTAVIIPILGIFAHAKLQGTMYDFGKKVSPIFSLIYCFIVYAICILLPGPRTASVTHEMAIAPFFGTSSIWTSTIYFTLVFIFAINRSKILDVLGKYLTPIIIIILLAIIAIASYFPAETMIISDFKTPFIEGIFEGYQTFDAMAAILVGAVLIISVNMNYKNSSFADKRILILKAGLVAGLGLFIIYAGLIYIGAVHNSEFSQDISRSDLLLALGKNTLGNTGSILLSVVIALACFTTAVGIVTGTADYFRVVFNKSKHAFIIAALVASIIGIVIGQFEVGFIITVAVPVLMIIYPITILLIILNILPDKWSSPLVFRTVILLAFVFSIPDALDILWPSSFTKSSIEYIPLAQYHLGWIMPSLITFFITNFNQINTVKP